MYFLTLTKSLFFFHTIAREVITTPIITMVFVTKFPNLSKSGSSIKFVPIFSFDVSYSGVEKKSGFEHSLALEVCIKNLICYRKCGQPVRVCKDILIPRQKNSNFVGLRGDDREKIENPKEITEELGVTIYQTSVWVFDEN